ncbi:hypothetical protein EAG_16032, partial [Camponotus floridanus]
KMKGFIKTHKDPPPTANFKNVIYKLNCNSCDTSYVG